LLFILFLDRNHAFHDDRGARRFNDQALTALALLVAQSDPKQKDAIIRLIMHFIAR